MAQKFFGRSNLLSKDHFSPTLFSFGLSYSSVDSRERNRASVAPGQFFVLGTGESRNHSRIDCAIGLDSRHPAAFAQRFAQLLRENRLGNDALRILEIPTETTHSTQHAIQAT